MKRTYLVLTLMLAVTLWSSQIAAQGRAATGIGIRGQYWNMPDRDSEVYFNQQIAPSERTYSDIGGFGGSLYFFSRLHQQLYSEFTIGAIGTVHEHIEYLNGDDVHASVTVPFLLGMRYELLPLESRSALQPYVGGGMGMYWLNDIFSRERRFQDEEVEVDGTLKGGAYANAGINFMISPNVALNYDMKYHWVDFTTNHLNSGFEFGLGISFMWGDHYQ